MGKRFTNFKGLILIPMIFLVGFSLAVIGSISPEFLRQQIFFFFVSAIVFVLFTLPDITLLQSIIWPVYALSLLFLLTTFFGPNVRGSTRWLEFLGMRIQPSELVKPVILLAQANILSTSKRFTGKTLLFFLFIALLPIILVFEQPDLGNTIIYLGTSIGLLFIAGMPLVYFAGFFSLITLLLPILWKLLKGYQRARILTFFNPSIDTIGAGYNAIQAMISVGSGQLFGRGLGRGPQSQLRFLPENHTDFIFASLSEELGYFASSLVLLSYFILLFALLRLARRTSNLFARYFIYGVFIQIFLHVAINVGMNLGMLPITGITLPLISYGGSSIFATAMLLGLVHAVSREKRASTIAIG